MTDTVEIKDFTFSDEPIKFKINEDVFYATSELPLGLMQSLTKFKDVVKNFDTEGLEPLLKLFDELLLDESATLFRSRTVDKKNPIGLRHIMAIIPWLLEKYGLRPTQPSSSSSSGSNDGETGTSSEAGVSLDELTQQHFGAPIS